MREFAMHSLVIIKKNIKNVSSQDSKISDSFGSEIILSII